MTTTTVKNPLLIGEGLPPFTQIKPDHVIPALTQVLQEVDEELTTLEILLCFLSYSS